MTFVSSLFAAFSFRSRQVTALALLLYAAVFVVLFVTDRLAPVSGEGKQHELGLDLEEAYQDLHKVRGSPRLHAQVLIRSLRLLLAPTRSILARMIAFGTIS
jgi:hypothetical protein